MELAIWDPATSDVPVARSLRREAAVHRRSRPRWLAFASELKAFLRLDGFEPAENTEAIRARLAGNTAEQSSFAAWSRCSPGPLPRGDARRCAPVALVEHAGSSRDRSSRPREQAEEFRGLLFDACALRCARTYRSRLRSAVASIRRRWSVRSRRRRDAAAPNVWRHTGGGRTSRDFRAPCRTKRPALTCAAERADVIPSSTGSPGTKFASTSIGISTSTRRSAGCTGSRAGCCTARCGATACGLPGRPWRRRAARRLRPPRAAGTHWRSTLHHRPATSMDLIRTLQQMHGPGYPDRPREQGDARGAHLSRDPAAGRRDTCQPALARREPAAPFGGAIVRRPRGDRAARPPDKRPLLQLPS